MIWRAGRRPRAALRPGPEAESSAGGLGAVAQRDGAEQLQARRDAESVAQLALVAEHAEEQRTEPLVLGGQQQGHHRHRRVDRPVRHRPGARAGAQTGLCLVRLGVAGHVGLRIGERQRDHRGVQQPLPAERVALDRRQRDVPEQRRLLAFEHHEVPPLGLAGARCPCGEFHQAFEHPGVERAVVERPGHAPGSDDVGEFRHVIADGVTSLSVCRASPDPRPSSSRTRSSPHPWRPGPPRTSRPHRRRACRAWTTRGRGNRRRCPPRR
jgi:hypothetical protein